MSEVRKYFRNNISGKFEPACSDTFLYEGRIVTTDKEGIENTSSFKSLEQWSKYPYTTKKYGEVNFIFGTYFRANVQHFIYLSDGWCLCIDFNRRVLLTKKFVDSETEIQVPADEYGPFGDICTLESGRKAILWNGAYFFSDGSYLNKEQYGVPPVAITTWNFLDAYRLSNIEKFLTEKHSVLKSLEIEHTRASALNVTFDLQATLYSIEVEHRKNPFPQKIWDKIADFRKELNEVHGSLLKKSETHKEFIDKVRAVFQANMDFLVESNLQDSHSSLEPGEIVWFEDPLDPPDLVKSWKDDLFDAGVRVAIRQGQKATVAHIAAVLCRNLGNSTEEFYNKTVEFLSSPVASAIILRLMSVGISAATSMTETPDPVRNALARELRIESLASPMEAICEVFTEPLRKEVCGFLEGVIPPPDMQPPPPPNKHQLSSPSTNQSLEFDQGRDMCELYHTPSLRILPLSCLR